MTPVRRRRTHMTQAPPSIQVRSWHPVMSPAREPRLITETGAAPVIRRPPPVTHLQAGLDLGCLQPRSRGRTGPVAANQPRPAAATTRMSSAWTSDPPSTGSRMLRLRRLPRGLPSAAHAPPPRLLHRQVACWPRSRDCLAHEVPCRTPPRLRRLQRESCGRWPAPYSWMPHLGWATSVIDRLAVADSTSRLARAAPSVPRRLRHRRTRRRHPYLLRAAPPRPATREVPTCTARQIGTVITAYTPAAAARPRRVDAAIRACACALAAFGRGPAAGGRVVA